jgi:hypothetical protein
VSARLPAPREAQQLVRLRTLRVQRARDACAAAAAGIAAAQQAVTDRQRQIERVRAEQDALGKAVAQGFDGGLARWSRLLVAQRDKLADRLERDEYALIGDERKLEEAQEAAAEARTELTRALAREDAVRGLLGEARKAVARVRETRVELEQEDQRMVAR